MNAPRSPIRTELLSPSPYLTHRVTSIHCRYDWGSTSTGKIGSRVRPSTAGPSSTAGRLRTTTPNLSSQNAGPDWLKYDRKVLRYYAYFREAVPESSVESFRIRRCAILYYLENGTVEITELSTDNSGIPQGLFLKRQKARKVNVCVLYHPTTRYRVTSTSCQPCMCNE